MFRIHSVEKLPQVRESFSLMLTGEGPDAKLLNNATMKHGVYFGENEVQEAKNVCVLSDADAKRLFGTDDVVGMTVDVNCYGLTKSLRICGVTTQKENGTFVSYTYEGMPVTINVPYTTMNEFTGVSDYFFSVTMQTDKSLNSQDVADKVVKLMEKRHQCAGKRLLSGTELSGYYELYESDAGYGDCFYLLCGG